MENQLDMQVNTLNFAKEFIKYFDDANSSKLRFDEYYHDNENFAPNVHYDFGTGRDSDQIEFLVEDGDVAVSYKKVITDSWEKCHDLYNMVEKLANISGIKFSKDVGVMGGFRGGQYGVNLDIEGNVEDSLQKAKDLNTIHRTINLYLRDPK